MDQIPPTPYFCREQIRERQVCDSVGFERDERREAPLGVVQIPPTPYFCAEQYREAQIWRSEDSSSTNERSDGWAVRRLPTPCTCLERGDSYAYAGDEPLHRDSASEAVLETDRSRATADSDSGPGPDPELDLDRRTDGTEASAESVDWTYVDWLDAAAVAAPVVTQQLLRATGLERLRPGARRFLERLAAVACWYVLLGDLGAAIGVGLFALESLRLVTTR